MTYEEYERHMAEKFPRYFGEDCFYGGFAIGEGWYPIIESLMVQIDHYTKWKRRTRAYQLRLLRAKHKGRDAVLKFICKDKEPTPWDEDIVDGTMERPDDDILHTPKVNWICVEQIKEKFGGLRFYYSGGDDHIAGLVRMAEVWADRSCETCGDRGKRREGGWIRTLCDVHEAEHKAKQQNMKDEDE